MSYFFQELQEITNFSDIGDLRYFQDPPADWWIVLTDVKDSTKAIESGRYKEVNTIAASSIAGLLNVSGDVHIPFVFGGDGTTALIPPELLQDVKRSMRATQILAEEKFDLHIRVAIIPVVDILKAGMRLNIGKLRISDTYKQAVFLGNGFDMAERLLKEPAGNKYQLEEMEMAVADFEGLTCRWQDIPSRHETVMSLIVKVISGDVVEMQNCYGEIITKIETTFGEKKHYQPVVPSSLKLSTDIQRLSQESRVINSEQNLLITCVYLLKILAINIFGIFQETFGTRLKGYEPEKLRSDIVLNTDYQKFDTAIKMVISATNDQVKELESFLQDLYEQKMIVYGIHLSDRALITCLVSQKAHQEVHFVDGADGGYALAAKQLKMQLKG